MKLVKLTVIVSVLGLSLYGIVRLIVDMINQTTDLEIGLFILPFLVITAGLFIWALLPLIRSDRLLKEGERAEATVLKVWDTGVTIDELDLQVGLLLEVRPSNRSPYQVKTKAIVSRIQPNLYQPGMVVQVRYDPQNPKKVAIEGIGERGTAGPANVTINEAVVYQGQTYTSADDLPPDVRAKYEQAMSKLADTNGDGIPDILESVAGAVGVVPAGQGAADPGKADPAEKLRKLQEMLAEDLITQQEYEAKKAEILSSM